MTECNTKPIQFSRVKRRQVSADFKGGRLTTDAGVLLLREADQKIGLIGAINDCLPDPRDPTYIIHELRESYLMNTDLEKAQVNRIRLVLLKVAARVTVSFRRIVLHWI